MEQRRARPRSAHRFAWVALASVGCGAAPATPPNAEPPRTTEARSPTAATAPAAPPAPAPDAEAALPVERRRFTEVVRCSADSITLHPVGSEWVGLCGAAYQRASFADASTGSAFAILRDGTVQARPALFRGPLPEIFTVRGVSGSSLDDFDVAIARPDLRGELLSWFRRGPDGLRPAAPRSSALWPLNEGEPGRAWIAGHELVSRTMWGHGFAYVDSWRGWLPRPAPGTSPECAQRIEEHTALALEGGTLWGLGPLCGGGYAVERFEVGRGGSTIEVLAPAKPRRAGRAELVSSRAGLFALLDTEPSSLLRRAGGAWEPIDIGAAGNVDAIHATPAGEIFLRSGTTVLRVAGSTLMPVAEGVASLVVAPEGAVWMHGPAGLLRWSGGALSRVQLEGAGDAPLAIQEVSFSGAERALLVVTTPERPGSMLLQETVETGRPVARLDLDGAAALASPFASFYPLRSGDCPRSDAESPWPVEDERAWVLLYRLSRTAPADYDFPATARALRGQAALRDVALLEIESLGERHLVGLTSSGAEARALIRRIRSQVPGSTPQAYCRSASYPHRLTPVNVTRRLVVDDRSGTLVPASAGAAPAPAP